MTNLEIYDIVKTLDGKIGTIVASNLPRTGIVGFNKTKSHITVKAPGISVPYIPLNEEAGFLNEVRDESGKILYKNTYKRNNTRKK